ncbi:hypothetical protein [Rhizobium ruizarguesonis]|uniref:hypothetical protein n=1 Tax=Rhizobium ruizarguesonis TaxID=2081791 RepID=UPI0013EEA704|nr:hypothetical protein [Rhizobium ruizarguesonis]
MPALSIIAFHVSDVASQDFSVLGQNGSQIVEKHRQVGIAVKKLFLFSFQLADIELMKMQ